MTFVNEYIPPTDLVKYCIEEIDKRYLIGGTGSRTLTIDRDRDVYIRKVATGREEHAARLTWTIYWKGDLVHSEIETIKIDRGVDGSRHAHEKIRRIEIPPHLAAHREEIVSDLRDALVAYKDGGVFSTSNEYTLTLEI